MENAQKPDVTAEEIQQAKSLWEGFTTLLTWGTVATIVVVALMALFLT